MKPLPSLQVLDSLLNYDPDTGLFTWKARGDLAFDAQYAGKPALTAERNKYLRGTINNQSYVAHRVAFKMMTGRDPIGVDHINGDAADNRWLNLREADQAENQKNQKMSKANTSGQTGVSWIKSISKWRASIQRNGKYATIGTFDTFEEAQAARKAAEKELNFHPNHGAS